MELIAKLERVIAGWVKDVPHLPKIATKWIGENVWWIVLIGLIISGAGALTLLISVLGTMSLVGSLAASSYYFAPTIGAWAIVTGLVSLAFIVISMILMGMAINPLRAKQKKGWTLLFVAWLASILFTVINAVLTLNPIGFITTILFGAIGLAISGYFVFEIREQFAHAEKSKGVKAAKS